ncbi:MAG: DUF4231 domain-containing protein, partial [bacterium]|nr:DUF4231 domain-containing protein [bacterium]
MQLSERRLPLDANDLPDVAQDGGAEWLKYYTSASVKDVGEAGPDRLTIDEYTQSRVQNQIDYYRRTAKKHQQRITVFRLMEFGSLLAVAVLTALASTGKHPGLGAWTTALATAGAAIVAHVEATRYERTVTSYTAVAMRLESLRDTWDAKPDLAREEADAQDHYVSEVEAAVSHENQSWRSSWH